MQDVLSDDTESGFRPHEHNTRRAKGLDSRVLIQLRVRSYVLGCYSENAADTLLTFSRPLRGSSTLPLGYHPPFVCFANPLPPKGVV
jgi:hypothetical protein